ncbi:MAG: hypothetical protein ABIP94_15975 [Planctomycetota bacterium]
MATSVPARDLALTRTMASALLGVSAAWATMPLCIIDFRAHYYLYGHFNPTGITGCQVMALAGFPIPGIAAHGGGGWRLGYHLGSDLAVHAANTAMLAAFVWWLLGRTTPRLVVRAYWLGFAVVLPAWFWGMLRMLPWWD